MKDSEAAQLVARIKDDLVATMRRRDQIEVSALKSLLASFSNAEAIDAVHESVDSEGSIAGASRGVGSTEAARRRLGIRDLQAIIQTEVDELRQAIAQLPEPSEYRTELQQKQAVLVKYLNQ